MFWNFEGLLSSRTRKSIPNAKNSVLGEKSSPLYLRGGTMGGYDLRDLEFFFLIGVGFEELLELQDL